MCRCGGMAIVRTDFQCNKWFFFRLRGFRGPEYESAHSLAVPLLLPKSGGLPSSHPFDTRSLPLVLV